jgi:1-deoxy-D-xylulose-5-phosphate reductoisomerase
MRKRIAILGSTGSIGKSALDVVSKLKGDFEVVALSANSNITLLRRQAALCHPKIVAVGDRRLAGMIKRRLPPKTQISCGTVGLREIVSRSDVDICLFAVSGASCLVPLVDAIKNKKQIALANKEALVSAGSIIMEEAKKNGVLIIPVDSEHSAIFQCIDGRTDTISRIYLTGSGGPLLDVPKSRFDKLPRRAILNHPKWKMGRKITVDSATMMNKGLEIIEAMRLFGVKESRIRVLVHPEAIVHSMVEFEDGSIIAQMASPDMRIPIQYALTYPRRFRSPAGRLDFSRTDMLTFREPDLGKFPCLGLAREAARKGAAAPAVLNASDEAAVALYLEGRIRFSDIPLVIEKVMSRYRAPVSRKPVLREVIEADEWAREEVRVICSR